jgi:hypothetical protein
LRKRHSTGQTRCDFQIPFFLSFSNREARANQRQRASAQRLLQNAVVSALARLSDRCYDGASNDNLGIASVQKPASSTTSKRKVQNGERLRF